MSGTCKRFISLITILVCKSARVGQRNREPLASVGFLECLLVPQLDVSAKIPDSVVLSGHRLLPGLASYSDISGLLGNGFRNDQD